MVAGHHRSAGAGERRTGNFWRGAGYLERAALAAATLCGSSINNNLHVSHRIDSHVGGMGAGCGVPFLLPFPRVKTTVEPEPGGKPFQSSSAETGWR